MPLKPREMEKMVLDMDGFLRTHPAVIVTMYIRRKQAKLQFLFIPGTWTRKLRKASENKPALIVQMKSKEDVYEPYISRGIFPIRKQSERLLRHVS